MAAREGFRFTPPPLEIDGMVDWLLGRAFGPPLARARAPSDCESAVALARELRLAARIATRVPSTVLREELGPPAALLERERLQLLVHATRVRKTLDLVAETAASQRLAWCLLKGPALVLSGVTRAGSRPSSDLDILVARPRLEAFQCALEQRGYRRAGSEYEHQAAALVAPGLVPLELHRTVPGVRVDGRRSAELDALARRGLLEPLASHPFGHLPVRAVLFAHALVHGLAQHGLAPEAYPALLLLADLADLAEHEPLERLGQAAAGWLGRDLAPVEVAAAVELATTLSRGGRPDPGAHAGRLLAHMLSGVRDADYAASLKLRAWRRGVTDHPSPLALILDVAAALRPAGEEKAPGSAAARLLRRSAELARRVRRSREAGRRSRGSRS